MADEEQVRKETAEDAADDLDLTDASAEEVRGGALQAYLKLSGQKSGPIEKVTRTPRCLAEERVAARFAAAAMRPRSCRYFAAQKSWPVPCSRLFL